MAIAASPPQAGLQTGSGSGEERRQKSGSTKTCARIRSELGSTRSCSKGGKNRDQDRRGGEGGESMRGMITMLTSKTGSLTDGEKCENTGFLQLLQTGTMRNRSQIHIYYTCFHRLIFPIALRRNSRLSDLANAIARCPLCAEKSARPNRTCACKSLDGKTWREKKRKKKKTQFHQIRSISKRGWGKGGRKNREGNESGGEVGGGGWGKAGEQGKIRGMKGGGRRPELVPDWEKPYLPVWPRTGNHSQTR